METLDESNFQELTDKMCISLVDSEAQVGRTGFTGAKAFFFFFFFWNSLRPD
jgi:hypothetical protein